MADIETRPHIKTDIELDIEKWPQDYALIQRQASIAIRHSNKPCIGEECCDSGDLSFTCIRHSRTPALVNRYLRRKKST